MKTLFPILLFLCFLGGTLRAEISTNFDAGFGQPTFADPSGVALADGNFAALGTFDSAFVLGGGLDSLTGLDDLSTLDANFTTFAGDTIFTINFGPGFVQSGSLSISGTSNDAATFDGQTVYLIVYQTADALLPDPGFTNVVSYGVYGSTAFATEWQFVDQLAPVDLDSTQIDTAHFGEILGGQILTAVPEPANYVMLFGVVSLFIISRRGRHRP